MQQIIQHFWLKFYTLLLGFKSCRAGPPSSRRTTFACFLDTVLEGRQSRHWGSLPIKDPSATFEAKSICFVVDIDLRVIGLLNLV